MIRRFGQPPQKDVRYTRRPGVYAILPMGNQVLLTAQITETVEIQLPGGGIDPGESAICALHRELLEETGWSISRPVRLGAFRRFAFMPEYDLWAEKLCHVYLAHPNRKLHSPREADHQPIMLSWEDAIASVYNDGDRSFLEAYQALSPR